MVIRKYKGYAYKADSDRYTLFFRDTKEEILRYLQNINKKHPEESPFVYCNIGQLNPETNKYIGYQKYDVETGRDISPIKLAIPTDLSQKALDTLKREFNRKGARFHPQHKHWYISSDNPNMEFFQAYLDKKLVTPEELSQGYSAELLSRAQKIVQLDSKQMELAEEKLQLMRELVVQDQKQNGQISDVTKQLIEAYNAEITSYEGGPWVVYRQEQVATPEAENTETTVDKPDYLLSISKDPEENRCTIYYKDGRLPVDLRGDQFNVHFPSIHINDTMSIIQSYLEHESSQTVSIPEEGGREYQVGENIDVVRPLMVFFEDSQEVVPYRIERVQGTVKAITPGEDGQAVLQVKDAEGFSVLVDTVEIYEPRQSELLLQAQKEGFSSQQLAVIGNLQFAHAQMKAIYEAFKDGLSVDQVAQFADPSLASWQMDLHRYGMQHGLSEPAIREVCNGADADWMQSRQYIDVLIKNRRRERIQEMARQGFQVDEKMIKLLERLDCITGKEHSLKDVCEVFKSGMYQDSPAGEIVKNLGRQFQYQEVQRYAAIEPEV